MKAESIGALIGSLLGAIGTGVSVYLTGNIYSSMIAFVGYLADSSIGRTIDRKA